LGGAFALEGQGVLEAPVRVGERGVDQKGVHDCRAIVLLRYWRRNGTTKRLQVIERIGGEDG
jgi:hypothetical protein